MLIEALIISVIINTVGFILGYGFKTDKFTDISYALTFTVIAVFGLINSSRASVQWIITVLILLWAARLGSYLLIRIRRIGRDKRFDTRRNSFIKFGSFWLLQAITVWIVMLAASLLYGVSASMGITLITFIGVFIAVLGIVIEYIADMQKFNFISQTNNKGKWIDSGLWKYSRHPNYFGEILMWIGIFVITAEWLNKTQTYIAVLSPMFISFMIIFVSGIPLLEKSAEKKWGNDKNYIRYRKTTSVLIPLPVKKKG
jgi:steroid 5-alpha reductase family enzyme